MWDDGPAAVTVSSYIHGYDETAITDDQLAAIKAEWTAQRQLNKIYWAAEPDLVAGMTSGDVWVAYAWQGAYATLLTKACRSPTPSRRKAATRGSASTASARTARTTTSRCGSSTRSSVRSPATTS